MARKRRRKKRKKNVSLISAFIILPIRLTWKAFKLFITLHVIVLWIPLQLTVRLLKYTFSGNSSQKVSSQREITSRKVNPNNGGPEEAVRSYALEILLFDLQYPMKDIGIEFPIQMGSSRKRVDLAVFRHNAAHKQQNIILIVECKRADIKREDRAIAQLKSYMSACPNAQIGIVAASKFIPFKRVDDHGIVEIKRVSRVKDFYGNEQVIKYDPHSFNKRDVIETSQTPKPQIALSNVWIWVAMFACAIIISIPTNRTSQQRETFSTAATIQKATATNALEPTRTIQITETTFSVLPTSAAQTKSPTQRSTATKRPPTATPSITPTATLTESMTPTPTVTLTASDTPTPTYTPTPENIAQIVASQNVNVRNRPSRESVVLTTVAPDEKILVLSSNRDGSWLQIQTSEDIRGWILAELTNWTSDEP